MSQMSEPPKTSSILLTVVTTATLGASYIALSGGLISMNKYIMKPDRFPFASVLVFFHMTMSSILSLVGFLLFPRAYSSLQGDHDAVVTNVKKGLKLMIPIAFFFAGTLVLSNMSYNYSSLAFIQMLKEGNLIVVYILSVIVALEKFDWITVGIIIWLLVWTCGSVIGEVHFAFLGFFIQIASQLCEVAKLVCQFMFLSPVGLKFDAHSSVLLMTPLCALLLIVVVGIQLAAQGIFRPVIHGIQEHWVILVCNAQLSFVLNVAIALFIKFSGATSFLIAGVLKDSFMVLCSVFVFGETVTGVQVLTFTCQLLGVAAYSYHRTFPLNKLVFDKKEDEKGAAADFVSEICKDPLGYKTFKESGSVPAPGRPHTHFPRI